MTTKQATKPVTPPCSDGGAHHWMVEDFREGNGGIVGGACKRCGAVKTFDGKPVVKVNS